MEAGSLIQAGRSKSLVLIEAGGFYCKFYGNFITILGWTYSAVSLFCVWLTGPTLGMFEVFGQTGPPTLGGRHFGP